MEQKIQQFLGHEPTAGQIEFFTKIRAFIASGNEQSAFILKGYAGTGKTSIMKALIPFLKEYNYKVVLLAPTGRAAKVLSNYTQNTASTIHKKIYRRKSSVDPHAGFTLNKNSHKRTLFIVDEASMISGKKEAGWTSQSLLDDLVEFVYHSDGGNRLLFVGDPAQLPPVGAESSPALDSKYLQSSYHLEVKDHQLKEVLRQNFQSGILMNATHIRALLETAESNWPQFTTKGYKDFYSINGSQLGDGIQYAHNKVGLEETMVICRSNKAANAFNQQIRNRILYREEELSGGDYLMVVKNNYHWLGSEDDFIANGEIVKVKRIRNEQEMHGFRFVDAQIELLEHGEGKDLSVKLMLDTLSSESPALSAEDQKKLYDAVNLDYQSVSNKRTRAEKVKADPFFNALQVKFAYAITCHKAQGGQWDTVFLDQGFLKEEMMNTDFLRWLYTAVTRAKKELFLVNFNEKFFRDKSDF